MQKKYTVKHNTLMPYNTVQHVSVHQNHHQETYLEMILGNCPTWRTNSFQCIYLFIVLYMFRACRAHHQEKQIVSIQLLVIVTPCWWQCRLLVGSLLPISTVLSGIIKVLCLTVNILRISIIVNTVGRIWIKKIIQQTMCGLIFSSNSVWNISHSRKNWTKYDHKCILVLM